MNVNITNKIASLCQTYNPIIFQNQISKKDWDTGGKSTVTNITWTSSRKIFNSLVKYASLEYIFAIKVSDDGTWLVQFNILQEETGAEIKDSGQQFPQT